MNTEQQAVIVAFGDAIKDERAQFVQESLKELDAIMGVIVGQALASVSDLDEEQEAAVKEHLMASMKEHTRRGLQRAIKGIARECDQA